MCGGDFILEQSPGETPENRPLRGSIPGGLAGHCQAKPLRWPRVLFESWYLIICHICNCHQLVNLQSICTRPHEATLRPLCISEQPMTHRHAWDKGSKSGPREAYHTIYYLHSTWIDQNAWTEVLRYFGFKHTLCLTQHPLLKNYNCWSVSRYSLATPITQVRNQKLSHSTCWICWVSYHNIFSESNWPEIHTCCGSLEVQNSCQMFLYITH
jgi:hypothetical protein